MENYLAIDIGGTYIKYAEVNKNLEITNSNKIRTPNNKALFLKILRNALSEKAIAGVAISCPGKVDSEKGIVFNGGRVPYLHEFNFKKFFKDNFNLPCVVLNDAKAAALAELAKGNLKNTTNGVILVLGTGVGGGIIVNGSLLQGSTFSAGEFSLVLREPDQANRSNIMGTSGSAVLFIEQAASILNLTDKHDGIAVFEAIKSKENEQLTHLFETYCLEIAYLIVSLQSILDIEKVVIGGGISEQITLINEIKKQYTWIREGDLKFNEKIKPLEIATSKFKNNANLLGAVYQFHLSERSN